MRNSPQEIRRERWSNATCAARTSGRCSADQSSSVPNTGTRLSARGHFVLNAPRCSTLLPAPNNGDASREQRAGYSSRAAGGQGSIPVRMRSTRSWRRFRAATQSEPERSGLQRHSPPHFVRCAVVKVPTDPCAVFKCPQVCGFDCPRGTFAKSISPRVAWMPYSTCLISSRVNREKSIRCTWAPFPVWERRRMHLSGVSLSKSPECVVIINCASRLENIAMPWNATPVASTPRQLPKQSTS